MLQKINQENQNSWAWNLDRQQIDEIKNNLSLLSYYSQGMRWIIAIIIVTSIIIGFYPSVLAVLFTHIVEDVLTGGGAKELLFSLIGFLLITYSVAAICEAIKFFAVPRFIAELTCRIRSDLYEHLLERSYIEVNNQKQESGRQSTTFLRDLTMIEEMLHRILDVSTIYIARILASFAVMFYYSLSLGLLMISVFAVVQIGIWKLNEIYTKSVDARTSSEDTVSTKINETLSGLEVIYYYDAGNQLQSRFIDKLLDFQEKLYTELHYTTMSPGIPRIIFRTFVYIMISIACIMALFDRLTVGDVTGIIAIGTTIVDPLQEINIAWSRWTRTAVSINRIAEVLSKPSVNQIDKNSETVKERAANEEDIAVITTDKPMPLLRKNLHLQKICFGYDADHQILDNIELTLPERGLFAINGGNGTGKSTLLHLIAGDFKPTSGNIYWDETDLNHFTASERKRKVRTVPQRPFLFDMTILDNILICNPGKQEQDVRELLVNIKLDSFIDNLPNGLYTEAGKRGSNLSGGQMQLVCFIRALISEPSILLMDEPFAAIDEKISLVMMEILQKIGQKRLVIVVSHNFKLNDYVDGIIYIPEGKLQLQNPVLVNQTMN